ncbi:D-glycero-beta-D-manno-heptose 1,7-bisphosphate 7-phosphatase [bacterium]|jgi:D-glycero-D-manno-heptose 1,7-bisphosphate phosphatase|nr:D-glycero-beta-D-manno-heptose 1,7-bisphosphate 7-phosphatase [bacterium]
MLGKSMIFLSKKKAVFLDRDGTLNFDPGYISQPQDLTLMPGVGEGLSLLKKSGYLLIVVSNQSGVARGLIPFENLKLIHNRLNQLLSSWGVEIDYFSLCTHHPDEDCLCRKPKPKLIQDAARLFDVDLSQSYMVGDRLSDIKAGYAAGCKGSLLVLSGDGEKTQKELSGFRPTWIAHSLLDVAKWIVDQENVSF